MLNRRGFFGAAAAVAVSLPEVAKAAIAPQFIGESDRIILPCSEDGEYEIFLGQLSECEKCVAFHGEEIEVDDNTTLVINGIADELKDLPQFAGFETILIAILSAPLPALLKCLFPTPEPPTPAQMKARVNKEWNPRRQAYDRDFIRRGKVQARKQAKAEGKLLSDKQAELIVITSADHFRLGEDTDLSVFGKSAWASPVAAARED